MYKHPTFKNINTVTGEAVLERHLIYSYGLV